MKVVFLDRDGTIICEPPDERIDKIEKIELFPDSIEALKKLAAAGYSIIFITNQAGISEGLITEKRFWELNNIILEKLSSSGITILKTYMCPHGPHDKCDCRKPNTLMLRRAAHEFGIDLKQSWIIGDRESDMSTGRNAGMGRIQIQRNERFPASKDATYIARDLLDAVEYFIKNST